MKRYNNLTTHNKIIAFRFLYFYLLYHNPHNLSIDISSEFSKSEFHIMHSDFDAVVGTFYQINHIVDRNQCSYAGLAVFRLNNFYRKVFYDRARFRQLVICYCCSCKEPTFHFDRQNLCVAEIVSALIYVMC